MIGVTEEEKTAAKDLVEERGDHGIETETETDGGIRLKQRDATATTGATGITAVVVREMTREASTPTTNGVIEIDEEDQIRATDISELSKTSVFLGRLFFESFYRRKDHSLPVNNTGVQREYSNPDTSFSIFDLSALNTASLECPSTGQAKRHSPQLYYHTRYGYRIHSAALISLWVQEFGSKLGITSLTRNMPHWCEQLTRVLLLFVGAVQYPLSFKR